MKRSRYRMCSLDYSGLQSYVIEVVVASTSPALASDNNVSARVLSLKSSLSERDVTHACHIAQSYNSVRRCPCVTALVHVSRRLSVCHGAFPCVTVLVCDIRLFGRSPKRLSINDLIALASMVAP